MKENSGPCPAEISMNKKVKKIFVLASGFTLALNLTACSVYKMEIQQGNALSNETISQLKPGMSKSEVATLMGNPLLQDDFHKDRWDYVYFSNKDGKKGKQKNITLLFKNEQLVGVKE